MKQLFPRGKRIRPTDKDLVFHTALAALFPVLAIPQGRSKATHPPPKAGKDGIGKQVV